MAGPSIGLGARRLAWNATLEVMRSRVALDDVFARLAPQTALPPRDEALARAIATVLFRRFGTIRRALDARLAKGWPSDNRLAALLAVGAAQIGLPGTRARQGARVVEGVFAEQTLTACFIEPD